MKIYNVYYTKEDFSDNVKAMTLDELPSFTQLNNVNIYLIEAIEKKE